MKRGTEFLLVALGTVLLFLLFHGLAWRERNYAAVGGEYLIFVLPILYYTMRRGEGA